MPFLPISAEEMRERGWDAPDIVLVTGDAYVDHPSFGTAIISRVLEDAGFSVCILSQPKTDADYMRFGRPRLAFYVNGGNIDSMVAHYTAAKKRRSEDAYTPGGRAGARPDRAVIVYSRALRRLFGDVPIAIGGLEASLRRFAHYDYWDDAVRPSILLDSGADLLMYGMGERHAVEIARRLADGEPIGALNDILGTVYAVPTTSYRARSAKECPSFEAVSAPTEEGKRAYAESCYIQQTEHDDVRGRTVIQRHGDRIVVQNPPSAALTTEEMDAVYALPFMRDYHPSYEPLGGVPGIEEVKFSIIHNRGCYGACNFCSLAYHQGRRISVRSHESVISEAKTITEMSDFKGYIHDIGGPTANFRAPSCEKQEKHGLCPDKKCLAPTRCPAVRVDHSDYLSLLRKLRALPKVKRVFIRSGIRFDYLIADADAGLDIFGLHAHVDVHRVHLNGLVALLGGGQMRRLCADHAVEGAFLGLNQHFHRGQDARVHAAGAGEADAAVLLNVGDNHADFVLMRADHKARSVIALSGDNVIEMIDGYLIAQGLEYLRDVLRNRLLIAGRSRNHGNLTQEFFEIH